MSLGSFLLAKFTRVIMRGSDYMMNIGDRLFNNKTAFVSLQVVVIGIAIINVVVYVQRYL
jgi:hypothetical protein